MLYWTCLLKRIRGLPVILVLTLLSLEMGCDNLPPEFDGTTDDGRTTVASVDSTGNNLAYGGEFYPSISADGSRVAFSSYADNLVPDDDNGETDVFVHDLTNGETTRVSVASNGSEGDGSSESPSISGDGRFIAFSSRSTNLTDDATNPFYTYGIYVHDLQTGITELVSINSEGSRADLGGESPAVSGDGRFVTFASYSDDLVLNDTNETVDVFLHDRETRETTLVSINSGGIQGNARSEHPKISADGRFISFWSFASNLVPNDTNETSDIFVHDRLTRITTRINVYSDGSQSDGGASDETALSATGRIIAFISYDEKLDGVLNGFRF
jgi:Tol biopolymer transport system component